MDKSFVIVSKDQILHRIRGEYLEMPGLRLTRAQAQRLWGLDESTCAQLMDALTEDGFLYRRDDGTYGRRGHAEASFPPMQMAKAVGAPGSSVSHRSGASSRQR